MERFIMSELGENEQVVLDVPVGRLRMHNNILRDGAGEVVFSIADDRRVVGERVSSINGDDMEALRIICQTPEKAEAIAKAFIGLAMNMRKSRKE